MGKRTRKTRWRTLPIGDEQSDSEESNSTLDTRVPPTYHQKYYNRLTYSSQSTPTRRYQSDSTKSTRSSSTASENKITFNEDEYTRITTPRQDVLFKKGYLNKPKTYSTQTSTGNSTTSTGNSTGNGTPDYQSTDLDYESHFMYPNGFLDQNGIYYVNSYEPYPLMVYNAPAYYNNDSCGRTKKYSTESLAETASTSNEETSQEAANHNGVAHGDDVTPPPSQVNGHQHHPQHHMPPPPEYGQVYNVVYPGFYYNGLCPPQELVNCQNHHSEPKRMKRRRRRKLSDSKTADGLAQQNGNASEYTEDDFSSVEEEDEQAEKMAAADDQRSEDHSTSVSPPTENQTNENSEAETSLSDVKEDRTAPVCNGDKSLEPAAQNEPVVTNETAEQASNVSDTNNEDKRVKYNLKPDAQEFVPRAMRPENLQYFKIQPGFMPVPLMSPMGAPNYGHPAYLPPGMPLGYIQQSPAIYPGYMPGFIPAYNPEHVQTIAAPIEEIPQIEAEGDAQQEQRSKNDIDIRTVVSKLEEVANDPQIPDRKTYHNNPPYKKSGQHKNYEERKKFYNKNNNNVQNGYYHKRQNGRYQPVIHNEASNGVQQKEDTNEIKECSKILEDPIAECVQEAENPEIPPNNTPVEIATSIKQPDPAPVKIEITQVIPQQQPQTTLPNGEPQNTIVKEQTTMAEKLTSSPKFQQRSTNLHSSEGPKASNKDNNYSDPRKRWPRRDEKPFQKRDQPVPEDRSNQSYKHNDSQRFVKKFNQNSPAPARKQTATQTTQYSNDNSKRYSETVKKSAQSAPVKTTVRENPQRTARETKPVIPEATNTPNNPTQWISVSSKKKRRNKNMEDSDNGSETPILEEEEDEKQPESNEDRLKDFQQNAFLQNMINGCTKVEATQSEEAREVPDVIRKSPVKIMEVRDLEKELLSSVGVEIKEETEPSTAEVKIVAPTKQKSSSKKKSKKGGQRQQTKRVFITDVDLSEVLPETKKNEAEEDIKEPEEIVVKEDEKEETSEEIQKEEAKLDPLPVVEIEVISEETVEKKELIQIEQTEKKNKKKKKKSKITEAVTNTPTNAEDTYDLLLENTLSNNSEDKTNMEISQELDLIIQRGMYSNLEEKIKALNIIPIKEEFFQSVVQTSRESSTEKSPEFTKLLANSMPKFKYCMASVEDDLKQPSTSRSDLFVENPEMNEILKDLYGEERTSGAVMSELVTRTSPSREIKIETVREKSVESKPEESNDQETEKEKLYPITQAVKNWMTKTRENTPEVEILKSPSKIFKEFCELEGASRNGLVNGMAAMRPTS
ncbi:uncharacterized protein LOC123320487 isoform X2 [Coccinella septempunctata]|uniref:uncharacterized protein LOC123320487 isoform X2 n=1 Tax=Coccinella septempunctata TaxID=41139 RepID=UPI001D0923FF|nr:uncharacterized protein LOC123320487 isoform X2 [Coccinella septempunctata]